MPRPQNSPHGTQASQDESIEQLLERLAALAWEAEAADGRVHEQVAALRRRRATWAEIGRALNVSRQAAWQRFAGATRRAGQP